MPRTKKKAVGIPTIDVALVVVRTGDDSTGLEIAVDTANQIQVEPQTSDSEAIQLIKLGRVIAQKLAKTVITGHQITLTDNVFTPLLAKIFQGGSLTGEGVTLVYTPPVAGSTDTGEIFELDCYSAVYDASGQIVKYECITYPNCQGTPISVSMQDDTFRLPEYVINSAPKTGEAPYTIKYVEALPDFSSAPETENGTDDLDELSVMSASVTVPSAKGEGNTEVITQ